MKLQFVHCRLTLSGFPLVLVGQSYHLFMRYLLLRSLFQKLLPLNLFNCYFLSQVAFGMVKEKGGKDKTNQGCKIVQVRRQPGRLSSRQKRGCVSLLLKDQRVNAIVLHVLVCQLMSLSRYLLTHLKNF